MRILVLRGGALGDFVLTLPLLGLIRRQWPDARIELAGNARAAAVAVDRGHLDAAHSQHEARWAKLGAGLTAEAGASDPFPAWLQSFDLIVNLWPDLDGAIARDLRTLGFREPTGTHASDEGAGARRFISHTPHPMPHVHAAASLCQVLEPLGFPPATAEDLTVRLHPSEDDFTAADAILGKTADPRPLVAWHPGSGSPRKNWPVERWLEVIAALASEHTFRLVVILGEAEREMFAGLRARLREGPVAEALVLEELPARSLAAVLARCALFLGHDTGPAHLAAAVGCPTVLVFGPTDPSVWAPPHPWVTSLRKGSEASDVQVADVVSVVIDALVRRPT